MFGHGAKEFISKDMARLDMSGKLTCNFLFNPFLPRYGYSEIGLSFLASDGNKRVKHPLAIQIEHA